MMKSASGFLKGICPWLCENWLMWAKYLLGSWKCPIARPLLPFEATQGLHQCGLGAGRARPWARVWARVWAWAPAGHERSCVEVLPSGRALGCVPELSLRSGWKRRASWARFVSCINRGGSTCQKHKFQELYLMLSPVCRVLFFRIKRGEVVMM